MDGEEPDLFELAEDYLDGRMGEDDSHRYEDLLLASADARKALIESLTLRGLVDLAYDAESVTRSTDLCRGFKLMFPAYRRATLGPREVDADARLADVHPGEIAALVAPAGLELKIVPPHLVALALAFDLDDAGAQIAEQARAIGSGQDAGQIQDGDAGQRQIFGLHESSSGILRGGSSAGQARLTPPPRSAIVSHQRP